MESMFDFVFTASEFKGLIVVPYLVLFLLTSYLAVQKLGITKFVKIGIATSYFVLLIAVTCAIPFVVIYITNDADGMQYIKLCITYTVGTSFYELFFKKLSSLKK
jgi:uncharacterized membrane protein YwzB